jgi:hypothetical protein
VHEARTTVSVMYVFFPAVALEVFEAVSLSYLLDFLWRMGAWKEHLQPMAGSPLMIVHYIGVTCLSLG